MFMLKADAYGHGLLQVARATEDIADAFGVATVQEGISLRQNGIDKDVLVLACLPCEMETAIDNGLTVGLSNCLQIKEIEELINLGRFAPYDIKLHIAVDSGMHRLGFEEDEIDCVLSRFCDMGVCAQGVYSHLRDGSSRQLKAFDRAAKKVVRAYPNAIRHIASSHSLGLASASYDMARVGLFGYLGAMSVKSRVIAVRRVSKGEYVSYGNFRVKEDTDTAVIFGGYADGVQRERPSSVYIRNKKCRVLGNVCMDMCVVECKGFVPYIGEEAVLCDGALIENIAKERKSIEYTLMTCWKGRANRTYIGGR